MKKTKYKLVLLTALMLGLPHKAHADPISVTAFVSAAWTAASAFVVSNALTLAVIGLNVYGASAARRAAAKAAKRARQKFEANLIDRVTTVLQSNPPWRIVYGNCMVGGDIIAIFTSDKFGVRSNGDTYTKEDGYKHIVVHVASHRITAINDMLIDGVRLGEIDGSGWAVNTSKGDGSGYVISSSRTIGSTSIPVAGGTGKILVGDEISFPGDLTRYKVTAGITAAGQSVTIASPGLVQFVESGTRIQLGNEFAKNNTDTRTVTMTSFSTRALDFRGISILSTAIVSGDTMSEASPATLSFDGFTITNPNAFTVSVTYTLSKGMSSVRLLKHLGTTTQAADSALTSLVPGQWTEDHRLQGLAYVIVTLDLEDQRFQGGPPNMAFDVSGKAVYDPRTGLTTFSENNALIINDFLTSPYGMNCDAADVNTQSVITAANACDEIITIVNTNYPGADPYAALPRYTLNGSFTTNDSVEGILEDMAESMAGTVVYGGEWTLNAGVWTAPVMDLNDDDLDGQISVSQAGAGMDTLFNGAHASFLARGRTSPSDIVPYQNSTFVTADGEELWTDYTLPYTDDGARARNLVRIFTERNRDGLVIQYPAKLKAWPLRVGDRVRVSSTEYGFALKYFRVTDWQFGMSTAVNLTLQEDGPGSYDQADAVTVDPQPNTALPNPNFVFQLRNVTAVSGTTSLQKLGDGSIVPRVRVTWDPILAAYVTSGGTIEIAWQTVGSNTWNTRILPGNEVEHYITGVKEQTIIIIRAVVINAIGVRSDPIFKANSVTGKTVPPANVTNLVASIVSNGILLTWDANTEVDYSETIVHQEVTWTNGAPSIYRGTSSSALWLYPSGAGTYHFAAKHRDTSNNISVTAATASVTVSAATAGSWALLTGIPANLSGLTGSEPILNSLLISSIDSAAQSAQWPSVSGAGKPADNATRNFVYYQGTTPVGAVNGDLWFNTASNNWQTYSTGVWRIVSDVTASKIAAGIAGQGDLATRNTVGTPQIDSNAATDAISNTATSQLFSATHLSPTTTNVTLSTTYTNSTGYAVVIQVEWSVNVAPNFYAGPEWATTCRRVVNGVTTNLSTTRYSNENAFPYNTFQKTAVDSFTLPNGQSVTASFVVNSYPDPLGSSIDSSVWLYNPTIRITAIKR